MAFPDWSALPSVVVVEILSKLPHNDRFNASSVCKSWRKCLFYAAQWKDFVLNLNICTPEDRLKAKYLTEKFARLVRQAAIHFESSVPANVNLVAQILEVLSTNPNIQKISICPASGRLEHQERLVISRYVDSLKALIKSSRQLHGIAFGCVEEIVDNADELLQKLREHHSNSLRHLYLASVKENPDNYKVLNIDPVAFTGFSQLQRLSLDYDYLSNELLENLARSDHAPLLRLDIHVHGVCTHRQPLLDSVWRRMCEHSPNLEVSLVLLHSTTAVNLLMDILRPSMRLARFSQYFCSSINVAAINFIADTFVRSFKTMCIVDSMDDFQPEFYDAPEEDPFVMLAWRCENLTEFTLIGYNISVDDLIAIARLRGRQLKTLKVPECCIEYLEGRNVGYTRLTREVSNWLDQAWCPVSSSDLHPALTDWQVDAVGVYIPTIFSEQTFF